MTTPHAEVVRYYEAYAEENRLASGTGPLEFTRTVQLLQQHLPPAPARVLDVGGAAGVYAFWLAEQGYAVSLVDLSPRLVAQARARDTGRLQTIGCADARALPFADATFDAVLMLGPLYHLPQHGHRLQALAEAHRVLRAGGCLAAAAISRYASALDGLKHHLVRDPQFVALRDRALADGCHVNAGGHPDYFTTAYFHRPAELADELLAAGFGAPQVLGIEGPGWLMHDFDARWADPADRRHLLETAERLQAEPAVVGLSAHLLALGTRTG